MDQFAGYLLLAFCVIVHVTVMLQVITGLYSRRRVERSEAPDSLLRRVVIASGTRD